MIRNLGQVAAIYIGSSAPRNTNLIWLDNTVVPFVFRAYDGSAWSEIATHKWVRAYVDGWLVTLPPRQLADDGDYMLINSNNVNYKITVKDFVKSAVGNPLDFKGVIRVSADFPNPSTLESGDMYVIITSPAGGTVTDPYSGKTFEDSEKIVWDEVTQSWESLGKIDITVDLTTSYSETEVTIHSSAGKETTIQGATDQLAGVMLPGQYSWLQALSNGSIVPGDPSPLTPLTPAHKHNYNDIINRLVSQQGTGESTIDPMSQKATTDALNLKFDKASVLQVSGAATDKVMSQKAVTDALKTLSDDFNNKLTNYLPLVGGTMKGSIRFPAESGIIGNADGTRDTYILRSFNNRLDIGSAALSTRIISNASDLLHHRSDTSYKIWDAYNLTNPVTYTTNTYNHATLTNKDGQYFTYIKAGTNGLLPHSKATLVSGGSGSLGTSDQSFNAAYINNLHTNKVTFGDAGSFIDNQSGDSSHIGIGFYTSQNAACPVYVGSLCVSDGYANSARNTPTNGIYSKGVIKSAAGFTSNFRQTNLNLAKTGNDVLYISSFTVDAAGSPGTDSNTGKSVNDGMFLTYFWVNDLAFQLAADIDGTGIAYRQYIPSSGNSTTGWKFLADTNWVVSKINSSTSNFLKKTGDTATGQIILDSNGIAFKANTWTNDLAPNRNYGGYLQVLDAYGASSAGGPTNYGTVLQVNSRNAHWANQLWFSGGAEASKNGLYYRHMAYNETTYGEWHRLLTNKDVNIIQTQSSSNPSTLPANQIFYSEIQNVAETPTTKGLLFSVQGDDEGIQLWASSSKTELYYRTKWASFGNWIKLATTSDLGNYLPLTGGTLSGNLTINTVGSTTLVINNNDTNGSETFMRVLRKGTASAAIGFRDSLGAYIYNYNSNKYLFIDNDGYARVGTTSGSTRLALITDIPTVSGYLPLTGGTLTGTLSINSGGSEPLIINNSASAGEAYVVTKTQGTTRGVMGWNSSLGMFLQDNRGYTFSVKADGVYFGASSSTLTKLPTSTDLSNYLPLTGGIVTGDIKLNTEAALYTAASSGSGYSYYKTISYDNDKGIILGASNTSIKIQSSDPRIYHIYKGTEYEIYSTNNLPAPVFAPGKVAGSLTPIYNNSFYINDSSYKVATIDNSYSFPKIYSPTTAGTAGQILQSTGGVPTWVNASSVVGDFVSKSGSTMTGALTMNSRRNNIVVDVVGGAGNSWDEGAGALSIQVPNDSGQTPLILARRSGAAINTTVATERLLSMELLDTGHSFIIGMSGSEALQLDWTSGKAGTGKLFGKTIATTDQIPSIPSISISNSGSGNAVTAISASGHTLTVTKGATYLTSHQTIYDLTFQAGTFSAKTFDPNGAAATVNIPTNTSHLTNDSGFITSSALNGYATQSWVNSQNFVKSTSTKKVTDIQPVDALPATQASGVLYLVFG